MRRIVLLLLQLNFFINTVGQEVKPEEPIVRIAARLRPKTVFLDSESRQQIDSVVKIALADTTLQIVIKSHIGGTEHLEREYQLSWDKAYSVLRYLISCKIDSSRINFIYGQDDGDNQIVDVSLWPHGSQIAIPQLPTAPIPCYSYHKLTKKRCKEAH